VLKCWTSHEGLRECGNNVPPEYAQEGYSEISSTGVVREKARAPSQEEIEAARQRAEAERVARERFTERATQDRVLLSTFTNEGDVQLASNGKEAVFESRIKLVQTRVADLERNLARLSEHAAQEERSGKGMSPQLRNDLEQVERQIAEHRQFIVDQRHEQEQVRLKSATDLERFRALKSGKVKPGDP
jgi:monoamine oxidase